MLAVAELRVVLVACLVVRGHREHLAVIVVLVAVLVGFGHRVMLAVAEVHVVVGAGACGAFCSVLGADVAWSRQDTCELRGHTLHFIFLCVVGAASALS
jgi:hypothetical protein